MTTKARRLSIYVSPKDTEVLRWMDEQTSDGTSESEAILRLVRRRAREEPTETERALREEIARLHGLLSTALAGRVVPPPTNGSISGGTPPPDAMTALDSQDWDNWDKPV